MTRQITLTALALALLIFLAQWRLEHPVRAQARRPIRSTRASSHRWGARPSRADGDD